VSILHGGPNSALTDDYTRLPAFLVAKGFAVLQINYRGSIGCGDDFVNALLTRTSTLDVTDCHAAVLAAAQKTNLINLDQVVLSGGSHGGFIAAHLAARYPVS
jgi:acylaminoacyl-peptidase